MHQSLCKLLWTIMLCTLASACMNASTSELGSEEPVTSDADLAPTVANHIIARSNSREKSTLQRISRAIRELGHLISEAETFANPDARMHFDYQRLRYDLDLITAGIDAHVNLPDRAPRAVDTIPGNFRH